MMTFDLARDYDRRTLCVVGLIVSNGVMASNPLTPDKSTLAD